MKRRNLVKKLIALSLLFSIYITSMKELGLSNYKVQKANNFMLYNASMSDENIDVNNQDKETIDEESIYAKAIESNDNLTDEYKEQYKQLDVYLQDNPYIDEKFILYILENFSVTNVSQEELDKYNVGAYYDPVENTICLGDTNYGYTHEGLHMTTDHYYTRKEYEDLKSNILKSKRSEISSIGLLDFQKKLGRGVNEGMTTLLDQEYFNGSGNYFFELILVKMLCEVIGEDIMLEAYTDGNIDLIIKKLKSITGDSKEATRLISIIDDINFIGRFCYDASYLLYQSDIEEYLELLNKYYYAKTGKNLTDDQILSAYCDELKQEKSIRVVKGYFSDSYKESIGDPYIEKKVFKQKTEYDDFINEYITITYYETIKTPIDQEKSYIK
jgi:hypothetical protein